MMTIFDYRPCNLLTVRLKCLNSALNYIQIIGLALIATFSVSAIADGNPPPPQANDLIERVPLLSSQELLLALAVLAFGGFVIVIEYKLLSRSDVTADAILRVLTVTLIVVISLAVVASGYGKDQIAPVLGLFGTIIGYLLGSAGKERDQQK